MNIIYKDKDSWLGYTIEENNIMFLHMDTNIWSLSVYKKFLSIFNEFLKVVDREFIYSIAKTEKAKKFNELFGFDYIKKEPDFYLMGLYVRKI
jgi:hypothetical protein